MYLTRLVLANFRNYSHAEWGPDPSNNILYGDNGQGKTNILEAVYFLSAAKSFRTSRDRELINWAAAAEIIPTARLEGEVVRGQQRLRLEIAMMGRKEESPPPPGAASTLTGIVQKRVRVNGVPRTAADFTGQLNCVVFSTEDIEIISGAPALRRRYLDDIKSQIDRQYLRTLSTYNRVLEQRNHLLRLLQEEKAAPDQLEFWNRELVDKGAYLMRERAALVENIGRMAVPQHRDLTSGQEELGLKYLPNLDSSPPGDEATVKQAFCDRLKQYQPREIGAGVTLVGPHRDDLAFHINGVDLGTYGSRGQQRTLALSLRLAEAKYLEATVNDPPVVLLDDVLSELDARRRRLIMEALPAYGQIVSTATELDRFEPGFLASGKVFVVKDGSIAPA